MLLSSVGRAFLRCCRRHAQPVNQFSSQIHFRNESLKRLYFRVSSTVMIDDDGAVLH